MDTTTNLNLPIPNENAVPPTNISAEFPRVALAFVMLDTIIHTLQGVVAGKANSEHSQAISTITGLTEALAEKMPANTTFSLDDLTDVQGATEALVNYVLVKKASGRWEPSSALAALGVHNHAIGEVVGLADVLVALDAVVATKADAATAVRVDAPQTFTDPQKAQARDNIGFTPALVAYNRWKDIEVFDVPVGSPVANYTKTGLAAFESLNLEGSLFVTVNAQIGMYVSSDNGATWRTTADHYSHLYAVVNASMGSGQNPSFGGLPMSYDLIFANTEFSMLGSRFFSFNKPRRGRLVTDMSFINSSGNTETGRVGSWEPNNAAGLTARNAIRVFPGSGNIYGKFVLSGREG